MKAKALTLLLVLPLASSCSKSIYLHKAIFAFDTAIEISLYEGDESNLNDIAFILERYSNLSDNYSPRDINNVYSINQINEDIQVDNDLYSLLKASFEVKEEGATYFNPLCGSLSKAWKEAIKNETILSDEEITSYLLSMNATTLTFKDDNYVQRSGEAEIDLGAIAKGYSLDRVYDYLKDKQMSHYLINAGRSSILLGEKVGKDPNFRIGLNIPGAYFYANNCFISTSSVIYGDNEESQSITIDGVTYSHIINPVTGSATPINDTVIVISDKGYIGDAFSTSLMNNTIDEIKDIEQQCNIKTIVINDNKIEYFHSDLKVHTS